MPRAPIEYRDASPQVRAIFDDIKRTRQVDDVNNFWKYLAQDPVTLARTWQSVKEVMAPDALDPLTKEMIYLATWPSASRIIAQFQDLVTWPRRAANLCPRHVSRKPATYQAARNNAPAWPVSTHRPPFPLTEPAARTPHARRFRTNSAEAGRDNGQRGYT